MSNLLASHRVELSNEPMAIEEEKAAEEEEEEEEAAPQHQTGNIFAEAFSDIEKDLTKIFSNDPNRERSLKLEHNFQNVLAAYGVLYQEKFLQARQSKMTNLQANKKCWQLCSLNSHWRCCSLNFHLRIS